MKVIRAGVIATFLMVSDRGAVGDELLGGPVAEPYRNRAPIAGVDDVGIHGLEALCRRLLAVGSGAEYRPGVDVYGDAVAPADVAADPGRSVDPVVSFDIPLSSARPSSAHDAIVTTVTVDTMTGQVALDGVPVNRPQRAYLERFCARQ